MTPNRIAIRTSLMALVFALLSITAQPALGTNSTPEQPEILPSTQVQFALTGSETGWLRSDNRIFYTENNGSSWQNVSPALNESESLQDAFFLDSAHAFALALSASKEEWQLSLLKTADTGASWQAEAIDLKKISPDFAGVPFGNAFLEWQDLNNGWILVKQATSSNFSIGVLLHTTNGGESWSVSQPPAAEEFVFADDQVGFMLDPVDSTRLYQTQDGGVTWQSIEPLGEVSALGEVERVDLPLEWLDGQLLLPAWTSSRAAEAALVFLTSSLDSNTLAANGAWVEAATAVVPQSLWETLNPNLTISQISIFEGKSLWVGLRENNCDQSLATGETDPSPDHLTCENKFTLLSIAEGGSQWQTLNLPAEITPAIISPVLRGTALNLAEGDNDLNSTQWIQIYQGQGFDACEIPTLADLQKWYTSSPYQVVNLYIGGISRGCRNAALTAAYVQQMYRQGWRFIPTWVGPQAPCTGYKNLFSYDPATAYSQGVDNANQARAKLLSLGLTNPDGSGSVVYYDLEFFTYSTACSAAARAFVRGWTTRLNELGIVPGLYATSNNLNQNKIYNLQPTPYVVWIAEWYKVPGYRPEASIWNLNWLDNKYWSQHQRIRQYSGTHTETWGGASISIDSNVMDGLVAVPYGADLVPPVTTYNESGTVGISPWYKSSVKVTLTATDNSVGVKATYYRINAGAWQTYSSPFQVGGSGQKVIEYMSVDFVDNWETTKTASFYVDNEPPINPVVTDPGCKAWNGVPQAWCNDPSFTWGGASDKGVGLNPTDTYEYYWGTNYNATSGTRTSSTKFNPPAIPTGVPYYLRIRAQDRQGTWSAWKTIYTLIYDPRFTKHYWLPVIGK